MHPIYKVKDKYYHTRRELVSLLPIEDKVSMVLPALDNYTFKRDKNVDLFESAKKRLEELKKTGKKLHLWYSGGIDSHFILFCMKKFDIWPDTIITYVTDPTNGNKKNLAKLEHDNTLKTLSEFGIPDSVERKVYLLDEKVYEETMNEETFLYSSIVCYNYFYVSSFFYKNIPDFPIDPEKNINIFGSVTPHIYYKNGWKFYYSDYKVFDRYGHILTLFIDESPEFLNAYVNSIINGLEKNHIIFNREMMEFIEIKNDRYLKKMSKEIKESSAGLTFKSEEKSDSPYRSERSEMFNFLHTNTRGYSQKQDSFYEICKDSLWVKKYEQLLCKYEDLIKKDIDFYAVTSKTYYLEN